MSNEVRESFVFYKSFKSAIKATNKSSRLMLYDAITDYALEGIEPELSGNALAMWELIKPQLEANNRRYLNGVKGGAFGSLGGAPKGNSNASKIKKQPLNYPKTTPNVNDNENDNENENENGGFAPPSIDQIREYITRKGYTISPEAFLGYYDSNGWLVGKNPMQSWKAAVKSWNGRDEMDAITHKKTSFTENSKQNYEFI